MRTLRSITYPLAFVMVIGMACLAGARQAAAGFDIGTCDVPPVDPVPRYDESQERVAALQSDGTQLFILVSPFRGGVSAETVRWLFLRQCAFAERFGSEALNTKFSEAEEQWADCAAAQMMTRDSRQSRFEIRAIQADLEAADDRFWQVNLGGRRLVDLTPCAKK